ncbi:hypothetical protein J2X31_002140 [Flavobacterium arsenatis]|uniref:DUF2271 domain-containing protein n=1 Tax=Flavobacterium arsenatis TaxID=1484332 RepID=A0ABU1TQ60_9FLAO|nr:DUF2271 domain-containing protein [Flavobacterium arsenatis]MDR6968125.1 hypothetical protein [Flavobacterium arsenatis]
MNNIFKICLLLAVTLTSFNSFAQKNGVTKYKCMVQMTNYPGEGAYIVVSLIDPKGAYEKTLYMMGPDKQWYKDLKEWNKFQTKKPVNISAISGASVSGGDRSMTVMEIENSKINAGYSLRFESAVENQQYHVKDLQFELTTENLAKKNEGTGYIRYVRLNAN